MLSIKTLYILILRGFIKWHLKTKLITEISYSCNDLIKELKKDINEFGEGLKLYVITENLFGAKI